MIIWTPDFCPSDSQPCQFDVTNGWDRSTPIRYCRHHQSLKDGGLTDAQVFAVVIQSCRVKETARWKIKEELMKLGEMDKEHPGVPYAVGADGNFTILSGKTGPSRTALRMAVNAAMALVEQPIGTSTVTVN